MARRVPLIISIVVLFIGAVVSSPTPVIIDTDVGSVFDDSAAIAVALQRPELDVRLMYVPRFTQVPPLHRSFAS